MAVTNNAPIRIKAWPEKLLTNPLIREVELDKYSGEKPAMMVSVPIKIDKIGIIDNTKSIFWDR